MSSVLFHGTVEVAGSVAVQVVRVGHMGMAVSHRLVMVPVAVARLWEGESCGCS